MPASNRGMISLLITVLVFLIILSLVYWVLTMLPLPAPIKQVATVILVVTAALYLIFEVLLPLAGHPLLR